LEADISLDIRLKLLLFEPESVFPRIEADYEVFSVIVCLDCSLFIPEYVGQYDPDLRQRILGKIENLSCNRGEIIRRRRPGREEKTKYEREKENFYSAASVQSSTPFFVLSVFFIYDGFLPHCQAGIPPVGKLPHFNGRDMERRCSKRHSSIRLSQKPPPSSIGYGRIYVYL
jgi:hypothetical protein